MPISQDDTRYDEHYTHCPACQGEQHAHCEYCEGEKRVTERRAEIIRLQRDSDKTDKIKA